MVDVVTMNKITKTIVGIILIGLFLNISFAIDEFPYTAVQENEPHVEIEEFIYSTYLGGSNADHFKDVVTDSQNNVIITGATYSNDFPTTPNAFQTSFAGGSSTDIHVLGGDSIIAKFNNVGNLLWSTYLGGNQVDFGLCVRTDSEDNIIIMGMTNSLDFPTTDDANQGTYIGGSYDIFITKFAPNGTIIYSSYFGTAGHDVLGKFEIDTLDQLVVTGATSSGFPVTPDAYRTQFGGGDVDGFLTIMSSNCSRIQYSTYLGGNDNENGEEIELDNNNNIIVVGPTASVDFPITEDAYQKTFAGTTSSGVTPLFGVTIETLDFFISKFNSSGQLTYSTLLGGSGIDQCMGMDVDSLDNIIVTGRTLSSDFPTVNAYQSHYSGPINYPDGFITTLSSDGQELVYSSYFGGNTTDWDSVYNIHIDSADNILVSGIGDDFPSIDAFQEHKGSREIFILQLSPDGRPLFGSYLGGTDIESPSGQFLSDNILLIVGFTQSIDFLVTSNAYQQSYNGAKDGFVFSFNITGYLEAVRPESTSHPMTSSNTSGSTITSEASDTSSFEILLVVVGLVLLLTIRKKSTI